MLNSLRRFIKKSYVNLTDERVKLSFFRWLLQKALFLDNEFHGTFFPHVLLPRFKRFRGPKTRGHGNKSMYISIHPFSLNFLFEDFKFSSEIIVF